MNRTAVSAVKDYHATMKKTLDAYVSADLKGREKMDVQLRGLQPATFERSAWDLAFVTQSLAHIDPHLVFSLSRIYTLQQGYADLSNGILHAMYIRTPDENLVGIFQRGRHLLRRHRHLRAEAARVVRRGSAPNRSGARRVVAGTVALTLLLCLRSPRAESAPAGGDPTVPRAARGTPAGCLRCCGSFLHGRRIEDPTRRPPQRKLRGPWLKPDRRVVDGKSIRDRFRIHTRETLDQMQSGIRAAHARLLGEVRRVDDERSAFPTATRIALPAWNRTRWGSACRNDSRVMNHLVEDDHCAVGLDDLDVVVVHARQHRWSGRGPKQTPLVERQFLDIGRRCSFTSCLRPSRGACLRLRRQRWQPSVDGIDDQRRASIDECAGSRIPPVGSGSIVRRGLPRIGPTFECGGLFRCQPLFPGQFLGTLERRHGRVRPGALEVVRVHDAGR